MELNKFSKKSKTLLDKSLKKDIDSICNLLLQDFVICDKYDNNPITHQLLYTKIHDLFQPPQQKLTFCNGFTKDLTRCSRKPFENYKYCKSHLAKNLPKQELSKYTKKYIDNVLYFTDHKYIYNSENQKVGYVYNNDYILTDDPFLLGELF